MKNTQIACGALLVLFLSGCAGTQKVVRDPEFAPARPEPVQQTRPANGAIYQAKDRRVAARPLFEDAVAHEVGDLVTIRLVEETEASKEASTSTSKGQDISMTDPTVFGRPVTRNGIPILNTSIGAEREFDGNGQSSQKNSLEGEITVTVAEVMANGNLVVRGEKILSLNQGDEYVRISGIVRPEDIQADNTVLSTKVANPQIAYGGSGVVHEANAMGWLARFFGSALFPF